MHVLWYHDENSYYMQEIYNKLNSNDLNIIKPLLKSISDMDGFDRMNLRLIGGIELLVNQCRKLSTIDENNMDLVEIVQCIAILCKDKECADEVGRCQGNKILLQLSKGNGNSVEPASDALSYILGHFGRAQILYPVDARDKKPRPFCVELSNPHVRILLRQLDTPPSERGIGDRANFDVGYRLWGAALVLTQYIIEHRSQIVNKSVLEIGAGVGLCGLTAAHSIVGAKHVVLTDFNHKAVENLGHCIALNRSIAQACVLDWECPTYQVVEPFDVIIGSDIVCEEDDCVLIANVLEKYLSPRGVAWITLGSNESRYGVEKFPKVIRHHGFDISQECVEIPEICLPGAGPMLNDQDKNECLEEIFIGTARSYNHYLIHKIQS